MCSVYVLNHLKGRVLCTFDKYTNVHVLLNTYDLVVFRSMFSFALKGEYYVHNVQVLLRTIYALNTENVSSTLKVVCYAHLISICTIVYVLLHF